MPRALKASTAPSGAKAEILETAERLCGERGLESVSVRDIAAEAKTSISVIYHHYGSKTNLLLTIVRARQDEIYERRNALLDEAESGGTPDLRKVVYALMEPLGRWRAPESGRQMSFQFVTRALVSAIPEVQAEMKSSVTRLTRIVALLERALPHLSKKEICWRMHFTMGVEHMNQWDAERLSVLSDGECDGTDVADSINRAIDYAMIAFSAPATGSKRATRPHVGPRRRKRNA